MRRSRSSLMAAVILVLLGGLGAVVAAQDDAASERVVSHEAAFFDGTVRYPGRYLRGTTESLPEELKLLKRGDGWEFRGVELSDPRLGGTWRTISNEDSYIRAGGVWTQARRIDNAAGSWLGHFTGYRDSDGRWLHQGTLAGVGAYEGLTAIVFMEDTGGTYDIQGMVFPGELPEAPDYPEPAQ